MTVEIKESDYVEARAIMKNSTYPIWPAEAPDILANLIAERRTLQDSRGFIDRRSTKTNYLMGLQAALTLLSQSNADKAVTPEEAHKLDIRIMSDVVRQAATSLTSTSEEDLEWEVFQDHSYYGYFCVRKKDQKAFGQGFHLPSGDEASALCDILNSRQFVNTDSSFQILKNSILSDPEYAWAWQCNLAVPIKDVLKVSHAAANGAAALIMSTMFGCDITQHPYYIWSKSPHQEMFEMRVAAEQEEDRAVAAVETIG